MYLGFYNFYRQYNGNRMFRDPSSPIGDDLMYPFVFAAQKLQELGHRVATLDTDQLDKFDCAIFFDHPTFLNPYFRQLRRQGGKKLYLFLFENEANRPDNYWRCNHRPFEKVFTWNPKWLDAARYQRFYLPLKLPAPFKINPAEKTKWFVTVASQKYNSHPRELYSERVRAIRWFERHAPADFDLYGAGWDRFYFRGAASRLNLILQKLYQKTPKKARRSRFPSWRGTVASKIATMRPYKFAICFENAVFPGYFTEKPLDAMFAGCVPIYWGPPDTVEYLPAKAFIDMRQFKSYEEMYRYVKGMSESEYTGYLAAIEGYLAGEQIKVFGAEYFTHLLIKQIIEPNLA